MRLHAHRESVRHNDEALLVVDGQPHPMRSDAEAERLWNDLLAAIKDNQDLFLMVVELERLADRFDPPPKGYKIPLSVGLRSIIRRAGDLADARDDYHPKIEEGLLTVAWRFAESVTTTAGQLFYLSDPLLKVPLRNGFSNSSRGPLSHPL